MRKALAGFTVITALALASAPAAAEPTNAGCQTGFTLAPASAVTVAGGQIDNVNHDGLICIKPMTNGSGSFFIFTDNVAHAR